MQARITDHRPGKSGHAFGLSLMVLMGFAVLGSAAFAQTNGPTSSGRAPLESIIDVGEPPEKLADVVVVFRPYSDLALHLAAPTERVIHGDIDRVEKGVAPLTIVHTARTIVAPLRAGVPVKLFLKAFPDRDAHYIIAVLPASYGGQP